MRSDIHIKILSIISFIVLILGVSGCVRDEVDELLSAEKSDYLRFSASLNRMTRSDSGSSQEFGYLTVEEDVLSFDSEDEASQTRAMPIIKLDSLLASVSTSLIPEDANWTHFNKNFIFDYEVLKSEADEDKISWSEVGTATSMNVYAFSPRPANDTALTMDASGNISYVAPVDAPAEHIDLIGAFKTIPKAEFNRTIPLDFSHILTGVRFKMGFECEVKSLTITNVKNTYKFALSSLTPVVSNPVTFSFSPNKTMKIGEFFNYGEATLMLPPQSFGNETEVILVYSEDGVDKTIKTSLNGKNWVAGKLITYTIKKTLTVTDTIYFDLAAGCVELNESTYSGHVFVDGEAKKITGTHSPNYKYYVYQSATTNRAATGITPRPTYQRVTYDEKSWGEFITNSGTPLKDTDTDFVEKVIHAWDNKAGATATKEPAAGADGAVRDAYREGTNNRIDVTVKGTTSFNLVIDNIYSTYMEHSVSRKYGGIAFRPNNDKNSGALGVNSTLTIYLEGDNRVGCVHYVGENHTNRGSGNKLIFENYMDGANGMTPGTLTAADVDYYKGETWGEDTYGLENGQWGYYGNYWDSAIGNNDSGSGDAHGIIINSGIIFAGTTKAENCSAIGAGGNGKGEVTINGGTVVAVATTTGTAIGGGIGFRSAGGQGMVTIAGGNVYAYNFANRWAIPSSAIGGAGSSQSNGAQGTVTITNGNVYAYSALGTAIGGGSSRTSYGGAADVKITGGEIIAKSANGAGIGGGTGCSGGETGLFGHVRFDGGNATIKISGVPFIKTGSIGGGETKAEGAVLGKADIEVSGGDIQAQFIMEATGAGAANMPTFTMTGGTIHNNNTLSSDFYYVRRHGGAVYMNEGRFTMTGGTIRDCSAEQGGAIYICGKDNPQFNMSGGTIKSCTALGSGSLTPNGGGVYLQNGTVTISESAEIRDCVAQNGGAVYLEGGQLDLYGGKIYDNIVKSGNGGGIYIIGGNLNMSKDTGGTGGDASIFNNTSLAVNNLGGSGGGIYMTYSTSTSDAQSIDVNLISGSIEGNSADRLGGGLCVYMDDAPDNASAKVTVGVKQSEYVANPLITRNKAVLEGGGLYVIGSKANMDINNGSIANNTTSGYVYNVDVANEKGLVTLNNTKVTKSVVITFNSNGGIFDSITNATTATQNIVTSTNSLLVGPEYRNYTGMEFVCWHTRPDGDNAKGKTYHDGDVMNLSENLTLYAIWKVQ